MASRVRGMSAALAGLGAWIGAALSRPPFPHGAADLHTVTFSAGRAGPS